MVLHARWQTLVIRVERDIKLFVELLDVKLYMLGTHQLQNAATATCTTLCLRNLGWRISDGSTRTGLEQTSLLGRSQFLTSIEAQALRLSGATILLDGAHTEGSARALMDTIKMTFPEAQPTLVVAMASDKEHQGFAKECLSGGHVEGVVLTEANIAGAKVSDSCSLIVKDLLDPSFPRIGNRYSSRWDARTSKLIYRSINLLKQVGK